MERTIKFRVKRGIDSGNEFKILKFKGTLITKGFTEIVHIADENEDFYINSFSISPDKKKKAEEFVMDYISTHDLADAIILI